MAHAAADFADPQASEVKGQAMFAEAMLLATAPLLFVNADIPSWNYFDARAPRASRARRIERGVCAPDAQKPNCLWEVNRIGGESRRPPDGLRAQKRAPPERAVCRGDES